VTGRQPHGAQAAKAPPTGRITMAAAVARAGISRKA
jgi:hypothetical protein